MELFPIMQILGMNPLIKKGFNFITWAAPQTYKALNNYILIIK